MHILVYTISLGLASAYLWALVAFLDTPFIRPVQKWLRRGWRWKLTSCPWCFSAYTNLVGSILLLWGESPLRIALVWAAASGLTGVLASSFMPGPEPSDES